MKPPKDFAIFILSHGRPDRIDTINTILKAGYTGPYFVIIDNEDKTAKQYNSLYGDKVIVFDKKAIAQTFDEADNFNDRRAVVYARNACFPIAREFGFTYFMQLDDDYTDINFRVDDQCRSINYGQIKDLNAILHYLLSFYQAIPAKAIAIAQGGDFIGGLENQIDKSINQRRKCMNTFICSTERPFSFVGRINEDVNTYTWYQGLGNLFLTFPLLAIQQRQSQSNAGGMTELYLDSGTYVKSFYTVLFSPSCVKVKTMGIHNPRLHHQISWDTAVPAILSEKYRLAPATTP